MGDFVLRLSELKNYELLDASSGERLERWDDVILIRPDPQVIWNSPKTKAWSNASARYIRSNKGGGHWEILKKIRSNWYLKYKDLKFSLRLMNFKHTGIFPEQATNWDLISNVIKNSPQKRLKVLNLFAYTGAASLVAAKAGAYVCHVDASQGMVSWAKENQKLSLLEDCPVRWIVDDCIKFVKREIRRGNKYDIILADPPSYGRGPNGELWKIEKDLFEFINLSKNLLSSSAKLFLINSYTAGLSPSILEYILAITLEKDFGGRVESDEIGLKVTSSNKALAAGSTTFWMK